MSKINGPYELRFEERPEYLLAEIKAGQMNETIARDYLSKIASKSNELDAERVMIIRDVPVMLPDSDLFDTTNFFLNLIQGKHVAFVNPHAEIGEDMEFAIRIGTNRGGNYNLFNSVKTAEDWLLETSKTIKSSKSTA